MLNLPKTVKICGKTYTVHTKQDEGGCNGSGSTREQKIVIRCERQHSKERIFDAFLHEVIELAACEYHLRYEAADEEVVFVMTHKQFDNFVFSVAAAIFPMIKE